MVEVNVKYLGNLRCEAIHGPSGSVIMTDAPTDNHGKGEAFSPTDLVAAALGSCMATIMGISAAHKGVSLDGLLVKVKKEMTTSAPRRIAKLSVAMEVMLPYDHPERAALEAAALSCPVHKSMHPETHIDVKFHWKG